MSAIGLNGRGDAMPENYVRPSVRVALAIGALLGILCVHAAAMQQEGRLVIVNSSNDTVRIERCQDDKCTPLVAVQPRSQHTLMKVTNGQMFRVAGQPEKGHTVTLNDEGSDNWVIR
jgi:hypothetical protein